jgi:hypothetical protein
MESIIKKAIEGGYRDHFYCGNFDMYESEGSHCEYGVICDPFFWESLAKVCSWKERLPYMKLVEYKIVSDLTPTNLKGWQIYAIRFHEINLTEGWDKAISYLENIISNQKD